jgi:hypothetical protein
MTFDIVKQPDNATSDPRDMRLGDGTIRRRDHAPHQADEDISFIEYQKAIRAKLVQN